MSYTALPTEILNLISQYLDVRSAISLAQTSSFSQEAAESRIYENIHIKSIDRFGPTSKSNSSSNDPINNDKTPLDPMFELYIRALDARPWRSSQVRSLIIEPHSPPPPELDTLLNMVNDSLHHLKIMFPTGVLVPNTSLEQVASLVASIKMPSLKKIEVDIGGQWGCLNGLLRGSKGLKELSVRGSEVLGVVTASSMRLGMGNSLDSSGDDVEIPPETEPGIEMSLPDVLQLEYLMVDRMDVPVIPILAKVINRSPRISTVILRDPLVLWSPRPPPSAPESDSPTARNEGDPLITALAERTSITSLEIPSTCLVAMDRIISENTHERFMNITNLTIAWEFPDLYARSGKSGFMVVGNANAIVIPTLPNLKTCIFTLWTHHCDPNAPPYSIYRGYTFDLSITAIKRHALNGEFETTPLLESIQLKDMYGPTVQEGSHPRCETDFDGAFITRYIGDEGDVLIHLRHRTAHSCGWEEYAVYGGREVPKSCLDGVMSVNGYEGRKKQVIQPGRAVLNDEAWEVLRHWATLL